MKNDKTVQFEYNSYKYYNKSFQKNFFLTRAASILVRFTSIFVIFGAFTERSFSNFARPPNTKFFLTQSAKYIYLTFLLKTFFVQTRDLRDRATRSLAKMWLFLTDKIKRILRSLFSLSGVSVNKQNFGNFIYDINR